MSYEGRSHYCDDRPRSMSNKLSEYILKNRGISTEILNNSLEGNMEEQIKKFKESQAYLIVYFRTSTEEILSFFTNSRTKVAEQLDNCNVRVFEFPQMKEITKYDLNLQ